MFNGKELWKLSTTITKHKIGIEHLSKSLVKHIFAFAMVLFEVQGGREREEKMNRQSMDSWCEKYIFFGANFPIFFLCLLGIEGNKHIEFIEKEFFFPFRAREFPSRIFFLPFSLQQLPMSRRTVLSHKFEIGK